MRNAADVTGGKPIAVLLQSISGVSAINPLVAFYDIHGGKREVLFFYFVPDTTRDNRINRRDQQKKMIDCLIKLRLMSKYPGDFSCQLASVIHLHVYFEE
jgi:hypothetical protein